MQSVAPPSLWQLGGLSPASSPGPGLQQPRVVTEDASDLDKVSGAYRHMKAVVREDEKSTDLYDLLQNAARDSYSSPQIPGVRHPLTSALRYHLEGSGHTPPVVCTTDEASDRPCHKSFLTVAHGQLSMTTRSHTIQGKICWCAVASPGASPEQQRDGDPRHGAGAVQRLPDGGLLRRVPRHQACLGQRGLPSVPLAIRPLVSLASQWCWYEEDAGN